MIALYSFRILVVIGSFRVNGRINVLSADELAEKNLQPELFMTDKNSDVIQATTLSVDEAYFHCPRSFKFASLWDTDQIAANANRSIKDFIQEAAETSS